jgi:ATP/maltotriose-dependent transcriptional regulator MalT
MIRPVRQTGAEDNAGAFVPILRSRVLEHIAIAAARPVVLIVAPAGYGKSIALRQYLATVSKPHARYDIGPEHATLLSFLRGFTEALGPVAPHLSATLAGAYEQNAASASRSIDLAR